MWNVEVTNEFRAWWNKISEREQDHVAEAEGRLEKYGPVLPFPHSSGVNRSKHRRMRELRIRTLRVFYAFDPRRTAILLIGGDKRGNDRFYEKYVRQADLLYDEHLAELREEGLIP